MKKITPVGVLIVALAVAIMGLFSSSLYAQVNYFELGKQAYMNGSYDQAITNLTESIRQTPDWTHSYYYRGRAYVGKKDFGKAISDFRYAIQLGYKDDEDHVALERSINQIIDVSGKYFSQKKSRINSFIQEQLGEPLASFYKIDGKPGEAFKINIEKNLIDIRF